MLCNKPKLSETVHRFNPDTLKIIKTVENNIKEGERLNELLQRGIFWTYALTERSL